MASSESTTCASREQVIAEELRSIREKLPESAIRVAVNHLVQLEIWRGRYARLVVQMHFPSTYPHSALCCELKSSTLPISALKRLEQLADNGAAERATTGQCAVLHVHAQLCRVVQRNLLLVAYDEVRALRSRYHAPGVVLETKDTKGEVRVIVSCANYETQGVFTLPPTYPVDSCVFSVQASDCPPSLVTIFTAMTNEVGRKLIRPIAAQPPVVAATLEKMVTFFIDQLAARYPMETCQMCKRRMLPEVSSEMSQARAKPARIVRVYCSHLYHGGCLQKFLETPPFDKGKFCPSPNCGKPIYHHKFKAAGNVTLAEQRWAHKVGSPFTHPPSCVLHSLLTARAASAQAGVTRGCRVLGGRRRARQGARGG